MKEEQKTIDINDKRRPYTKFEKAWTIIYLVAAAVDFCFFAYLLISSLISIFSGSGLVAVVLIIYNCYINSIVLVALTVAFFIIRGVYKRAKLPLVALLTCVSLYAVIWIVLLAM